MLEGLEVTPGVWERLFPDQNQREAIRNFINNISSLKRLGKVILLKLPSGGEKFYVFFPTFELTTEEMENLGSGLDESFAEIEDPHQWVTPIEMTDEEYQRMQGSDSKIKAADEFILWQRAQKPTSV